MLAKGEGREREERLRIQAARPPERSADINVTPPPVLSIAATEMGWDAG